MKILKFGGKSLANGKGLNQALDIIQKKVKQNENIKIVVSARGNTTTDLEEILHIAKSKKDFRYAFETFKQYQLEPFYSAEFEKNFKDLFELFKGVSFLGDYSEKIKDEILAHGELFSAKTLTKLLAKEGINASFVDSRQLIVTDDNFGSANTLEELSRERVVHYFKDKPTDEVQVITGFIASNQEGCTTTLGKNGSNYTASLLANYLGAEEFQNYTHVDGIFTANPQLVSDAKKIEGLTFTEANELANFGASILHSKTIVPLIEKQIPLRILNTFNESNRGTYISSDCNKKGIKSINVIDDVSLVNFEGRGLLGKVGVDARIFKALSNENISVSIISQGSSERGIGFIVKSEQALKAKQALEKEFEIDIQNKDVNSIEVKREVTIISTIGQDLKGFHKAFNVISKNGIKPLLINNTLTGNNICLVVERKDLKKTVNLIHQQVFGVSKKINIAIFGKGLVGGTLIDQILESSENILERRNVELNLFAVGGSSKVLLDKDGISHNWKESIEKKGIENYSVQDVIQFAKEHHLENLIAVDNTASEIFVENYIQLVENGFDLVSSNKVGNTISYDFYTELRQKLKEFNKQYLYETNVGAGLPLIDTIKLLHHSGEDIVRIRGVFSGSLSYLFNKFSSEDKPFSEVLQEAIDKGFTEPDPREDLCGNDVARKLLILARELDLNNEISDVEIQNLIPEKLREITPEAFLENLDQMNAEYQDLKESQKENHVLRYTGDLYGDLSTSKEARLQVKLVSAPSNSPLGSLKGSDSIFEIYTKSYGKNPLVI
ncbi:MAG: aspartate kinase, partial [Flavobacteriaceae bacterium]|nr:aspartate kinase [Flavobacteriaceae bacterium]